MRIRSAFLVLAAGAAASAAHAQPIEGFYVNGGAGARIPFATKATSHAPGFGGAFDLDQKTGYDTRFSAGYALGNGWRFELEANYGASDIKGVTGAAYPTTGTGRVRTMGGMANALFDLDVGSPYVFPYLGLGVGYEATHLAGVTVNRLAPAAAFTASGDQGGFAAQVIGGLSFPVPGMPGLSVTTDYRVMDVLGGERFSGATGTGAAGALKLHNQFNQGAILSVRYAFNTPMPAGLMPEPATPAAPAARAKTFQVLFALGSATLDQRARAVITEAARAAADGHATRIEVDGNADTSGQPGANQALSERRAKAVSQALTQAGVPKDSIAVQAFGDTKPAVATGPGVQQAQNRRVDIVVP